MICSMQATGVRCPPPIDLARQLESAAACRLAECGYPVLRKVACEYCQGTLTLRGRVPTYYLKQMAQVAVGGCAGVERVENCLVVDPEAPPSKAGSRK